MTTHQRSGAYVDTTALLPIDAGEQPVANTILRRLEDFDFLFSSNLLEAEVREALERQGRHFDDDILADIRWIMPNRPLASEMATIDGVANLPAGRLWHLATALFFAELIPSLAFITLDEQQETVARELGLWIP